VLNTAGGAGLGESKRTEQTSPYVFP